MQADLVVRAAGLDGVGRPSERDAHLAPQCRDHVRERRANEGFGSAALRRGEEARGVVVGDRERARAGALDMDRRRRTCSENRGRGYVATIAAACEGGVNATARVFAGPS
jgi:hypothetical protein